MMVYWRLRSTLKIILLRFNAGVVECILCSLCIRAVMVMHIVILALIKSSFVKL